MSSAAWEDEPHAVRHDAQGGIPDLVAVVVVHEVEVGEVDVEHRPAGEDAAADPSDLAVRARDERPLADQSGQRVRALRPDRRPMYQITAMPTASGAHQPTTADAMTSTQMSATSSSTSRRKLSTATPKTPTTRARRAA